VEEFEGSVAGFFLGIMTGGTILSGSVPSASLFVRSNPEYPGWTLSVPTYREARLRTIRFPLCSTAIPCLSSRSSSSKPQLAFGYAVSMSKW